nr:MAG TPA: hypothetical protein [Caudoviricetes sp.]
MMITSVTLLTLSAMKVKLYFVFKVQCKIRKWRSTDLTFQTFCANMAVRRIAGNNKKKGNAYVHDILHLQKTRL